MGSRYYGKQGIDYSGETESKSDCDLIVNVFLLAFRLLTSYLKHGVHLKMEGTRQSKLRNGPKAKIQLTFKF